MCFPEFRQKAGAPDISREVNPTRIAYHFYNVRNDCWMALHSGSRRTIAKQFGRRFLQIWRLSRSGQFQKAGIVAKGLWMALWFSPVPDVVEPTPVPISVPIARAAMEPEPVA